MPYADSESQHCHLFVSLHDYITLYGFQPFYYRFLSMAKQHSSLTATNLAQYHHLNCDLYIHNVYHKHPEPAPERFSYPKSRLLLTSQYERGIDWETTLYSWLDESDLLLKVPGLPLQADVLLENILADERDHFFITGITFNPPKHQLQELFFRAGTEQVNFGVGKPDLLEIVRDERGITWTVIDAKASKAVKVKRFSEAIVPYTDENTIRPPTTSKSISTLSVWSIS